MLPTILIALAASLVLLPALNFFSYRVIGAIIRNRLKKWDLNICCGRTDGGGVNVDIVNHGDVPDLVVPPLWDLCAVLNIFEHRHLFVTFRKEHHDLPRYIELPGAQFFQERLGQKIRA
jgi:hypothetical protein